MLESRRQPRLCTPPGAGAAAPRRASVHSARARRQTRLSASGADVSMLSQFAFEKEVLFPPYTMMLVLGGAGAGASGRDRKERVWDPRAKAERTRQFVAVSVRPYFV